MFTHKRNNRQCWLWTVAWPAVKGSLAFEFSHLDNADPPTEFSKFFLDTCKAITTCCQSLVSYPRRLTISITSYFTFVVRITHVRPDNLATFTFAVDWLIYRIYQKCSWRENQIAIRNIWYPAKNVSAFNVCIQSKVSQRNAQHRPDVLWLTRRLQSNVLQWSSLNEKSVIEQLHQDLIIKRLIGLIRLIICMWVS